MLQLHACCFSASDELMCVCREQLKLGQTLQQALTDMQAAFAYQPAGLTGLGAMLGVGGCSYLQPWDAAVLQSVRGQHPTHALEVGLMQHAWAGGSADRAGGCRQ